MNEIDETLDILPEKKGKNQFLNILTILTFIACAYGAFNAISFYFTGDSQLIKMEERLAKLEEAETTGFGLEMMYKGIEMMRIRWENNTLFLISEMFGMVLCFLGAFQMRKLQKTGYYLWIAGEYIPIIASIVIIGSAAFNWGFAFVMIVPIAFTIMYGSQLKHMNE